MCDKGSDSWRKANDYAVRDNSYTVTNLPEGGEFEFRVAAINAAGPGDASTGTAAVKIREKVSR
jgi:hypothetical protein